MSTPGFRRTSRFIPRHGITLPYLGRGHSSHGPSAKRPAPGSPSAGFRTERGSADRFSKVRGRSPAKVVAKQGAREDVTDSERPQPENGPCATRWLGTPAGNRRKKMWVMSLPGFRAEVVLREPSRLYRVRSQRTGPDPDTVLPAMLYLHLLIRYGVARTAALAMGVAVTKAGRRIGWIRGSKRLVGREPSSCATDHVLIDVNSNWILIAIYERSTR